jgi:hypothetical protein
VKAKMNCIINHVKTKEDEIALKIAIKVCGGSDIDLSLFPRKLLERAKAYYEMLYEIPITRSLAERWEEIKKARERHLGDIKPHMLGYEFITVVELWGWHVGFGTAMARNWLCELYPNLTGGIRKELKGLFGKDEENTRKILKRFFGREEKSAREKEEGHTRQLFIKHF